jgi:ubiquinone/menaquinone biosynthesis C-methylase UbiE
MNTTGSNGGLRRIKGRPLDNTYFMPRDQHELNRLNLRHRALQKAGDKNIFAPVRNPRYVLDVGCGTAKWCQEIAHHFQHARVVGLDIDRQPIDRAQSTLSLPPNFKFVQANALRGLSFPDASFDYVHARFISSFVPLPQWPEMIAELVRVIRPGGWLELVENGLPPAAMGPLQREITQAVLVLFERLRIGFVSASLLGWVQDAGLSQTGQRDVALRGKGVAKNMYLAVKNLRPLLLQYGLLSAERFEMLISGLYEEMLHYQTPLPILAVWGTKPAPMSGHPELSLVS